MELPPPSSASSQQENPIPNPNPKIPQMDLYTPSFTDSEQHHPPSSSVWDFSELLDFTFDEQQLDIPWSPQPPLNPDPSPPPNPNQDPNFSTSSNNGDSAEINTSSNSDPDSTRVRKRDPRLVCSNFLAGRIPCACPEMDEKLEKEEEEGMPGKKKSRTSGRTRGSAGGGVILCQVPGCEADIRELKGYHKRHRVCLRCANATSVMLDGVAKRYCQQCGKFHILMDFDEGKRSCRRKLERHNNRRRKKPVEPSGVVEKEGDDQNCDVAYDEEIGKDIVCLGSQLDEQEPSLEPDDGPISTLCSGLESQTTRTDSALSFQESREAQLDGGKENSKLSPSYGDNKSTYSSVCPTGRISFKLYDWNPAEFPRRLRHQILQWLASMPIELEGYIRPGCIILTVFIAMPKFVWDKVLEDPVSYINDLVVPPGRVLSGRGPLIVFLRDMVFHVMNNGGSIVQAKVEAQAPRLHYVHPMCFEAGKPMDLVACGSNLLQPNLRFLVSFRGKYLECNYAAITPDIRGNINHQSLRVHVPQTEASQFGPAFIEVDSKYGLSSFIPVLIGSKEVCSEMRTIEQKLMKSVSMPSSMVSEVGNPLDSCVEFSQRQRAFSEFLVDIAWLLKEPSENLCNLLAISEMHRFSSLLKFLVECESTIVLEKILQNLKIRVEGVESKGEGFESKGEVNGTADSDLRILKEQMDRADEYLYRKLHRGLPLGNYALEEHTSHVSSQNERLSTMPMCDQDMEMGRDDQLGEIIVTTTMKKSEAVPLLDERVIASGNPLKNKTCNRVVVTSIFRSRPTFYAIAIVAVCFGVCAVLLHPNKVGQFAVAIRRSLLDTL